MRGAVPDFADLVPGFAELQLQTDSRTSSRAGVRMKHGACLVFGPRVHGGINRIIGCREALRPLS